MINEIELPVEYKRRSSDDDHQIASIPSQERALRDGIPNYAKLNFAKKFEESKSAKKPGRPFFNEMVELLESGKAKSIIAWHLNRLARNPVDGGRIIWLVQNFGIKIHTPGKTYTKDELILLYVEFGMANQFINDLQKTTKRGLDDKVILKQAPQLAPVGYLNNTQKRQGERDIMGDEKRFSTVRKMWDLLLSGSYNPKQIFLIAKDEWGFTCKDGHPLSRSRIYEMFRNPFYMGRFKRNGEVHEGTHPAMVTPHEFSLAQKILDGHGRPRKRTREIIYNPLLKCVCGSSVTTEERYRKICPSCHFKYNAEVHAKCPKCDTKAPEKTTHFAYCHCDRGRDNSCIQPHITVKDLEKQIDELLSSIEIHPDFVKWAMDHLRRVNAEEGSFVQSKLSSLNDRIIAITRLETLLFEKWAGEANSDGSLFSDEQYKTRKNNYAEEKKTLQEQLNATHYSHENWLETAEKTFIFSRNARYWFAQGDKIQKRAIIQALGSNLILKDRKLHLDLQKPLQYIQEAKIMIESSNDNFEPADSVLIKGETSNVDFENLVGGDRRDSNPQPTAPQAVALPLSYDHHI
jgi:site-specific DNA recombinase